MVCFNIELWMKKSSNKLYNKITYIYNWKNNSYYTILVIINKIIKMIYFILILVLILKFWLFLYYFIRIKINIFYKYNFNIKIVIFV